MRVLSVGGVLACLVLVACGGQPWCDPEAAGPAAGAPGGGGAGGTGGDTVLLQAPQLTVDVSYIKTFSLAWSAVAGATTYRLIEDIDGPAGPQAGRVIAEVPADQQSFSTEVFLPDRMNASYQVLACNGTGCTESAPTGVVDIDRGIGFFKASQVAEDDQFGASLAISADGQLFAVGVPGENGDNAGIDSVFSEIIGENDPRIGAVYVFRRSDGVWVRDAYIKPATAQTRGYFGASVALAGDAQGYTLLVGAPEDASGTPAVGRSGAFYVFERAANGGWAQDSYFKAATPVAGAEFGFSVSLSQDRQWAAVGQPYGPDGGSVLLYQRTPAGWEYREALRGSNTESDDAFGEALQLDATGATLVVGAAGEDGALVAVPDSPATDDDAASAAGAVYVFKRNGVAWEQSTYLKAPVPEELNAFGASVALSSAGTTMVVGEPGAIVGTTAGAGLVLGRVHLFHLVGSTWVRELDFISPLGLADGAFGTKVALATDADGATLVITDPNENTAGSGLTAAPAPDGLTVSSGSAFVYRREGMGAWSAPVPVKAPNNQPNLRFGASLALSAHRGTLAVFGRDNSGLTGIGATPTTDTSVPASGAVYLY